MKDFNKTEEDFSSAREFGDYQEFIEDIIYNLANNIEVQETNRQIADYKETNKNFINKNRQKNNRELLELEDILSEEKKQSQARRQLDLRLDKVSFILSRQTSKIIYLVFMVSFMYLWKLILDSMK